MNSNIKVSSNKSFGIVFFIFFLIVSLYPLIYNGEIRIWSIFISIIFLILGLLNSVLLSPLNFLWFKLGIFLGKIVSPLIMGLIYFIVVTPIGLIMRIIKKDVLNLKFNNKKSYWVKKTRQKNNMKKQF